MKIFAALVAFFVLLTPAWAAPTFPALSGRVVDDAHILSDATKADLDQKLAGLEQKTSRQLVVVTIPSLQGYEISDYGYQLGRAWGIGQKGKDNGVLLIVVPSERKAHIEVGYGLEGSLTDAQSRIIIERYMKPAFKKGDYDAGLIAGTEAVLATLGNTSYAKPDYNETADDQDDGGPGIGFIIFLIILFVLFRARMFWPLLFLGGFGGGRGGWGGGGGWSSGGGGGGFSGGGGSFGGGGASGSW